MTSIYQSVAGNDTLDSGPQQVIIYDSGQLCVWVADGRRRWRVM